MCSSHILWLTVLIGTQESKYKLTNYLKGDEDRLQADEVNSNAYVISSKQKPLFIRSEEEEMEPEVNFFFYNIHSSNEVCIQGDFSILGQFLG